MSDKTPTTAAQFKMRLASVMIDFAKAESLRHTRAFDLLAKAGIPNDLIVTDGGSLGFTVPNVPEPTSFGSVKREDLTATAIKRYEAQELWNARYNAYRAIRCQQDYGYITAEQCVQLMSKLDLPVPSVKTSVSVNVTRETLGDDESFGTVFTIDGKADVDAIKAHFAQYAKSDVQDAVRALYPQASKLNELVYVSTSERNTWPDFPDFVDPTATETGTGNV